MKGELNSELIAFFQNETNRTQSEKVFGYISELKSDMRMRISNLCEDLKETQKKDVKNVFTYRESDKPFFDICAIKFFLGVEPTTWALDCMLTPSGWEFQFYNRGDDKEKAVDVLILSGLEYRDAGLGQRLVILPPKEFWPQENIDYNVDVQQIGELVGNILAKLRG